MAIANFRGNTARFNQTMRSILPFLMNQGLMRERQTGLETLEGQRQAGRLELEGVRTQNTREELEQKFFFELAKMPEMDRRIAVIFDKDRRGEDTTQLKAQLKDVSKNLFLISLEASQGKLTPESIRDVEGMSEKFVLNLFGEQGQSFRQERDIAQKDRALDERVLQRERVGEIQAETGRGRLALDVSEAGKATTDEQTKRMLVTVRGVQDFLTGEGVRPEDMTDKEFRDFSLPQIGGPKADPKIRDPLSPQNRGKLFTWIAEMEIRLNKGTMPTPAEEELLARARNTFQIQAEGLPARETGVFTSEDPIQQRLIEAKADAIVNAGYIDPETGLPITRERAIEIATRDINQLK